MEYIKCKIGNKCIKIIIGLAHHSGTNVIGQNMLVHMPHQARGDVTEIYRWTVLGCHYHNGNRFC